MNKKRIHVESPSSARTPRRAALAALALSGAFAFPAFAAEPLSIPISSHARKAEPLPAGEEIQLSLDQTISLALRNILDLEVASYNTEKAGFGIGSAAGVFDPYVQLDANARRTQSPTTSRIQASDTKIQNVNATFGGLLSTGATYTAGWANQRYDSEIPGFTTVNPTFGSNISLGATQPLLRNFGKTVTTRLIVQARIARDQSAWDFVKSVQGTIVNVENAYWDLVYALANLDAKKEALDRAKDLNRITQIKINVGALAPIDIVQTEVTIAQREQDIIVGEGLVGDAQDRLKRLLNVSSEADWNRPIRPTSRPDEVTVSVDVEKGLKSALELRPEVKQSVVDIESKKLTLVYNRNQLLPRLDATGSYGLGGVGAKNSDLGLDYVDALYQVRGRDFPGWSFGLTLNVPIGNRVARSALAFASTDLELSRTNLALLRQNLQVEVRAAARNIDTARRSVAAAKKSRELAERNLDAERKKYENGMTTSFQVSQIQNDLTTARSAELLAIAGYLKSIVAWHQSIGDLLQVKNVTIQGLPVTLDPTPAEEGAVR